MKNQIDQSVTKSNQQLAVVEERRSQPNRVGTKTFQHRYERRKIREQLRHLDWALSTID